VDGPCRLRLPLTDHTACPCLGLLSCERQTIPAAVADVLVLNVHKPPSWALSLKEGMGQNSSFSVLYNCYKTAAGNTISLHLSSSCQLGPAVRSGKAGWAVRTVHLHSSNHTWRTTLLQLSPAQRRVGPAIHDNASSLVMTLYSSTLFRLQSPKFKLLRSPRIVSKEPILSGCGAWRADTTTLLLLGS
jgi:hypothetical protein